MTLKIISRQLDQSLNFSYIPSPICQRVEVEEPPKPAEEVEVGELPAASVWTGWRSEGSRVGGGEPGFAGGWRSSGEKSPGGAVEATGFPGAWRSSGEERSPGGGWRSTGYRQGLQDIKDRLEVTLETRDQDHSVSFQVCSLDRRHRVVIMSSFCHRVIVFIAGGHRGGEGEV